MNCGDLSRSIIPALIVFSGAPLLTFDHAWIVVPYGAPQRAALERAGLRLAPGVNRHEGQGTASVTVEFENTFLELLWPDSTVKVTPGKEDVAKRFERQMSWQSSGWSPFGLKFRRAPGDTLPLPFPSRSVRADWMPPGEMIELLTPAADTLAPNLSVVPRGGGVPDAPGADSVLRGAGGWATLRHPLGVRRVTGVRVLAPSAAAIPSVAKELDRLGAARFEVGDSWVLELTFDGGMKGRVLDLRPQLPLILRL